MATTPPAPDEQRLDAAERRALENEIAALRERLRHREAALTALNRRLVALERFDATQGAPVPDDAEVRARAAEEELARVLNTRTFRYTASARGVYRRVRRLGGS